MTKDLTKRSSEPLTGAEDLLSMASILKLEAQLAVISGRSALSR
jgi:hypothetical protein